MRKHKWVGPDQDLGSGRHRSDVSQKNLCTSSRFKEASSYIIFEDMFMEVRGITFYVPPLKMGANGLLRNL